MRIWIDGHVSISQLSIEKLFLCRFMDILCGMNGNWSYIRPLYCIIT